MSIEVESAALLPVCQQLARLCLEFGRIERATLHEDGVRPETDSDHTVMLGVVACAVAASVPIQYALSLDVGRVAELALVHDLAEARSPLGDVCTLGDYDRDAKREAERAARAQIEREFRASQWLLDRLAEYENQRSLEAQVVRYLDKVLPKLTHALNGCAAVQAQGMDRAGMVRAHSLQTVELAEEYPLVHLVLGPLLEASMLAALDAWRV